MRSAKAVEADVAEAPSMVDDVLANKAASIERAATVPTVPTCSSQRQNSYHFFVGLIGPADHTSTS